MIRIVATSRQAVSASIFLVVLCGLAVVFGRPVLQIDFTEDAPGVKLPFVELLAIVAGMGILMLLYPRFWQLERVASSGRTKVVAGLVALVGMIAPLFVLIPSFIALSKVP